MTRKLLIQNENWPLSRPFAIARGSSTSIDIVTVTIKEGGLMGRGECRPYARFGETPESVSKAIEGMRSFIEAAPTNGGGGDRRSLLDRLAPGAARNAIDAALIDLECKIAGLGAAELLGLELPEAVETAGTVGLAPAAEMAAEAARMADYPLLKIKLNASAVEERLRAVRRAAPQTPLLVDANEAWSPKGLKFYMPLLAELGVAALEQPLAEAEDAALSDIDHLVPVIADESFHSANDLAGLRGLYDGVNVKLDKCGGLTAALQAVTRARAEGFLVMVGCMVGTSLAMAPAALLAPLADFVDLDGPLWTADDRENGFTIRAGRFKVELEGLWGAPR
ncbi:MAG: dipeptide epimerase [Sphingomonadales bacterium]